MTKKNILLALTFGAVLSILCSVFIISNLYNIPYEKFTGDPALIFKANPFIGVVSNIGILFWCCAACICLFSGLLLLSKDKDYSQFLIFSGFFSTILLLDDFFIIHDYGVFYIFPNDFSQKTILGLYALFAMWYLYKFQKIILTTNFFILGAAFFFLGLSVLIDVVFESKGIQYFIEDGFKFIGITGWTLYFTSTSYELLSTKVLIKC
ncbi:hypothetical protein WJN01_09445 [Flavobacteriaceae bacterium SZ-1-7]|uniref:hypothetical protein n=1 Tax=Tamlana sedimenti TaxID=3134126 RepID=UPI0031221AFC